LLPMAQQRHKNKEIKEAQQMKCTKPTSQITL